ncbi:MAG: hypothetical protein D6820_00285, partial [Lentisphaerae bacterium]
MDVLFSLRVDHGSSPEAILIDDLRIREIIVPTLPSSPIFQVAFVGNAPSVAMISSIHRRGWGIVESSGVPDRGDILVVNRRLDDEKLASALAMKVKAGASLILGLGRFEPVHPRLAAILPVNPWPNKRRRYKRYGTRLRPWPQSAGNPFTGLERLAVSYRADMHLPFAPIEHGEHRYNWQVYHKDLFNSDWRIHLVTEVDGQLPVLVSGRYGPGKVVCFAGHLFDPVLLQSPDYPQFCQRLLDLAVPEVKKPPSAEDLLRQLRVVAERYQPGKTIRVTLSNPARREVSCVLSWKLSNWCRELMNAGTLPVRLSGGERRTVEIAGRSVYTGDPQLLTATDREIPYRRLQLGILSPDRRRCVASREWKILTAPQLSMEIIESSECWESAAHWPRGKVVEDGYLGYRFIYRPGERPSIMVTLRNGLLNLAPLARAMDQQYPENPSIGGLNDLSYSLSSIRGLLPLQGGWSGKPAATQQLRMVWDGDVLPVKYRLCGYGPYRFWQRANPRHFTIRDAGQRLLAVEKDARFRGRFGKVHAYYEGKLSSPARPTSRLDLKITGLDAKKDIEPRHIKPSNCSILEWEVYGWPRSTPPPAVDGILEISALDLTSGLKKTIFRENVHLAPLDSRHWPIPLLTAKEGFSIIRYDLVFIARNGVRLLERSFDTCFVPETGRKLINKATFSDWTLGLLCSPGWVHINRFGTGTRNMTRGWGGPDDKIWAIVHNQMEEGSRAQAKAERLFTTANRFCHYTNAWRDLPNGRYNWDWIT